MSELAVFARLVEHSPTHYIVVVSTASTDDDRTHTDLRLADAPSRAEAEALRKRMVGEVVDRLLRRGDQVSHVRWMESVDAANDA